MGVLTTFTEYMASQPQTLRLSLHYQQRQTRTLVTTVVMALTTGRRLNTLIFRVCSSLFLTPDILSMDFLPALPCDSAGNFISLDTHPLPPQEVAPSGDWSPFESEVQFKVADLLYRQVEMSAAKVDTLMELWALSMADFEGTSPFKSHSHMHTTIDASHLGDVPWQCMVTRYSPPDSVGDRSRAPAAATWLQTTYKVCYRNPDAVVATMLANVGFAGQFDWRPYVETNRAGAHHWNNVMSGNVAWRHCVSVQLWSSCWRLLIHTLLSIGRNPRE